MLLTSFQDIVKNCVFLDLHYTSNFSCGENFCFLSPPSPTHPQLKGLGKGKVPVTTDKSRSSFVLFLDLSDHFAIPRTSINLLLIWRIVIFKGQVIICGFFQCCGSGMFIPDPGSWFLPIPDLGSRIPDPGSRISDPKTVQKRGVKKKLCCHSFFCSHKFHKM